MPTETGEGRGEAARAGEESRSPPAVELREVPKSYEIGVGVLVGNYPAWDAARTDAIGALRHE